MAATLPRGIRSVNAAAFVEGAGTDDEVDRVARLWRYALTPFLWPYYLRENPSASSDEMRHPFNSLIHGLVELAFPDLGRVRITAPTSGGRPIAARVAELRRRDERILGAIADEPRTVTMPIE